MKDRKRLRRSVCLVIAAVMVLSFAGSSLVMAAEPEDEITVQTEGVTTYDDGDCGASGSDDVSYYWDDSSYTMTISGTGAMADYDDEEDTPWYGYFTEIHAVVIEDGVTEVGNYAFSSMDVSEYNLTSVTFGNTLTRIGRCAFWWCQGLTEITIPASVEEIGRRAFSGCKNITTITFEGDAPAFEADNVFNYVEATAYYPADNATWTEDVMSDYGGTITWVAYDDSASSGSDSGSSDSGSSDSGSSDSGSSDSGSSDSGSSDSNSSDSSDSGDSDSSVDWTLSGNTLKITGSGAIEDYSNASEAPWYAYKDEITKVVIGSGVTGIGTCAFDHYTNLTGVTFSNTVTEIGDYAFEDTGLTSVTIPNSVTYIGWGAFGMCSSLKTVTIGTGIKTIEGYAFEECASLTKVTFKGNAPAFGDYIFLNDQLTAYYPSGNSTWTSSVRQSYGGTVTWKVTKKSQTITVKASSLKKSIKASKLKKKKQTFKIKASAKGKLTYTKKSGNKKITVSKNGKVTVKKGLGKGTYKVKVKIKAAATSKYTAKTVTKTVKVTVK